MVSMSTGPSRRQSLDKPGFNNPSQSAIERLRLVEEFGMAESRALTRYSDDLLAAASRAVQGGPRGTTGQQAPPTTPTRRRHGRPLSSPEAVVEGRPALKRIAVAVPQEGGHAPQHVQQIPLPPNNALLNSIQSSMQPTGFGFVSHDTSQAPDPGSNNPLNFDATNPNMWSNAQMDYTAEPTHPLQYNANATGYEQYQHNLPASSNSGSLSSSSESSLQTHGNTVFTAPSNCSHGYTAPGTDYDENAIIVKAFQIIKEALASNQKTDLVATSGPWNNAAKNVIINFFFGFNARFPATADVPFGNYRNKVADRLHPAWGELALEFDGLRSAPSLATQWGFLEDTFCYIMLEYVKSSNDSLITILGRIYHAIASAGLNGIPTSKVHTMDLLAWADGGENGWFAQVYTRAVGNSAMQSRMDYLRRSNQQTIRASSNHSVASHLSNPSRKRNTRSTRSEGSVAVLSRFNPPTPLAPSSENVSNPPGQQGGPGWAGITPEESNALAEMMRESKAANRANIDLALSKAAYLRIQAADTRNNIFEKVLASHNEQRERQFQNAIKVLKDPMITDEEIRKRASRFVITYLEGELPPLNYKVVLDTLLDGLPSIEEVADVYQNAPALAPGSFEAYHQDWMNRLGDAAARQSKGSSASASAPHQEFTVPDL